jgi:YHS domain-containing protein
MKKLITIITVIAVLGIAYVVVAEDEVKKPADTTMKKMEVKELTHQTVCPVDGKPIDSTTFTDMQGQRVYFDSQMCSEKFLEDPDTYFKKAGDEGILFENIQTSDPICGMKLDKKTNYSDFEGRRIYFCSDNCKNHFNADPMVVLNKMAPKEMQKSDESQQDTMKHHEHMNDMEGDSK